jgi:hypothetical protein
VRRQRRVCCGTKVTDADGGLCPDGNLLALALLVGFGAAHQDAQPPSRHHGGVADPGLWYPVTVAAATAIIGLIFLPETKDRDIFAGDMRDQRR